MIDHLSLSKAKQGNEAQHMIMFENPQLMLSSKKTSSEILFTQHEDEFC